MTLWHQLQGLLSLETPQTAAMLSKRAHSPLQSIHACLYRAWKKGMVARTPKFGPQGGNGYTLTLQGMAPKDLEPILSCLLCPQPALPGLLCCSQHKTTRVKITMTGLPYRITDRRTDEV